VIATEGNGVAELKEMITTFVTNKKQ
jgi:hypothetical protein